MNRIALCLACLLCPASTPALASKAFNVGFRVVDIPLKHRGKPGTLSFGVWYPTAEKSMPHAYAEYTRGKIAMDAAPEPAGAPYPLLVFSHGYGGGGLGVVFLAEALAERGWIVAAPDHRDRHTIVRLRTGRDDRTSRWKLIRHAKQISKSTPKDRPKYLYRPDELRAVLDAVPKVKPFRGLVDTRRVAVGGHSFGGYTALGVSGAIPGRRYPWIKALLLLSTGAGGYLYTQDELAAVRVPTALFLGEKEKQDSRGRMTMEEISDKVFGSLGGPKHFLEIRGATHYSFANDFSKKRRLRFLRIHGKDQARSFHIIRRRSIAFLEAYVLGDPGAKRELLEPDPMVTRTR